MKRQWETAAMGNQILDCGDFYISFRANTSDFGSIFTGDDDGAGETALCSNGGKYMILNGDFRKDYEKRVDKGFEECLKFYKSKKKKYSSVWSE